MIAGAVVCFLSFMALTFKSHKESEDENLKVLELFVLSLGVALPSALVLDALFKMIETGEFKFGGATFYGGLLSSLAVFFVLLSVKKRKVPVYRRLCDLAACIPFGHCLGRVGCFCGGCCFGSPTDCIFGVVFPEGSNPYNFYGGAVKIHPTQLYEAVFLLILGIFLLTYGKKDALPLYLILYGAVRSFIEFFRNDDRGGVGLPLSPAQLISIILIVLGALIFTFKDKFGGDKKQKIAKR